MRWNDGTDYSPEEIRLAFDSAGLSDWSCDESSDDFTIWSDGNWTCIRDRVTFEELERLQGAFRPLQIEVVAVDGDHAGTLGASPPRVRVELIFMAKP